MGRESEYNARSCGRSWDRHPSVVSFSDAGDASGWGATVAVLNRSPPTVRRCRISDPCADPGQREVAIGFAGGSRGVLGSEAGSESSARRRKRLVSKVVAVGAGRSSGGAEAEVSVPEETPGQRSADVTHPLSRDGCSGAVAARYPSCVLVYGSLARAPLAASGSRSVIRAPARTEGRRPARMPAAEESTAFPRLTMGRDARDGR